MNTVVSVPSKEGIGQRPADLVQKHPPEQTLQTAITPTERTVIFDSTREVVGNPFTALIERTEERTERERQVRLGQVRMLLGEIIREKAAAEHDKKLTDIYFRRQAEAFGFRLPIDPSRVNGEQHFWEEPKREDFDSDEKFEAARSEQADTLAYNEKNALSGISFI